MLHDPALASLETRRKRLLAAALTGIVALIAAGIACLFAKDAFPPWSGFLVYLVALLGVVGWFVWQIPWSLLQLDYKETVARPAVAAWRQGWALVPERRLPRSVLEDSGFCAATPSQYHSEDLTTGPVAGTTLECAEVVAARSVRSTGRNTSRREILFQGALGRAVVGRQAWNGRYYYLRPDGLAGFLSPLPGHVVRLDDETFEKTFHLTWDGRTEPPAVWTPTLRAAVLAIRHDLDLGFRLSWDGATLWIGTTSLVDLWEPPLWHRLDGRRIARGLQTLEVAARLVEAFCMTKENR